MYRLANSVRNLKARGAVHAQLPKVKTQFEFTALGDFFKKLAISWKNGATAAFTQRA
jgi:hypothetical protein